MRRSPITNLWFYFISVALHWTGNEAILYTLRIAHACSVVVNTLDLDLVPPVLIRTLGDELSPCGTVVGSISRVIRINTQCVQILLQCVLPCPLWSSDPPPATFWSPYYGQTSWSGYRESQDVSNKSSLSGSYLRCAACPVRAITWSIVICDVVAPWNARYSPKASGIDVCSHYQSY